MLSSELLRCMSSSICDALEMPECINCSEMAGVEAVGFTEEALALSDRIASWGVSGIAEAPEVLLLRVGENVLGCIGDPPSESVGVLVGQRSSGLRDRRSWDIRLVLECSCWRDAIRRASLAL